MSAEQSYPISSSTCPARNARHPARLPRNSGVGHLCPLAPHQLRLEHVAARAHCRRAGASRAPLARRTRACPHPCRSCPWGSPTPCRGTTAQAAPSSSTG
eukprot:1896013-Prymnesium_polylepis.2